LHAHGERLFFSDAEADLAALVCDSPGGTLNLNVCEGDRLAVG
jgi:hypothetical protein